MQPNAPADGASMIRLERVRKEYGDGTVAVHDLDLDVGEGEVCVLIGPSGCGKTTTMRMINRLVEPTSGRILLDGDDVTRVDPVELRRRIGYVIQHVGLFPHQTVSANVGTVPRLLGWDRKRTRERSTELLELVGLDPARFGSRYPHELSGGQRQRVGVARALAADPPVLLMDEPFGAVDPIARDRLQAEFLRLQEQVRKTVVIVTHDMDEAVRLGDRVAVMRDGGYLEQYDAPGQIYAEPATAFVADFIGADRAARRLAVAHVTADALVSWPTVDAGASLADARSLFDAAEADQLVVLSGSKPLGWVQRDEASGDGVVGDRVQEAEQVQLGQSLEDALGLLIAAEHPGVLVSDKDRLAGVLTAAALVSSARAG